MNIRLDLGQNDIAFIFSQWTHGSNRQYSLMWSLQMCFRYSERILWTEQNRSHIFFIIFRLTYLNGPYHYGIWVFYCCWLFETQNSSGQRKYYKNIFKTVLMWLLLYMPSPELVRDSVEEPALLSSILVTATRLHFSLPVWLLTSHLAAFG